jgi:cell division protein FtsI/penicillin-binding protein 2
MTSLFITMFDQLAASRTAWRRARNLRSGRTRRASPSIALPRLNRWACGFFALAAAGALALVLHADALTGQTREGDATEANLAMLQPAMAGAAFEVPDTPGASIVRHGGAALLIASRMRAEPALRIDLCSQMLDPGRPVLLPLRIGYPFTEAAALSRTANLPARNVVLAEPDSGMPRVEVRGSARLSIAWQADTGSASWAGGALGGGVLRASRGEAALGQGGWLVWNGEALRLTRVRSRSCPQAGELVIQRYRPDAAAIGPAMVQAFASGAPPVSLRLPAGSYSVPANPAPGMEDKALFDQLHARGLIKLGRDGLVHLAPRDLAAWADAAPEQRAPLDAWSGVRLDETDRKLLARLHHRADGAYVREQVRVYNSERRLVAWRTRPGDAAWHASASGSPAPLEPGLPVAAMRLFARLPEGWEPWSRVAGGQGGATVTLRAAKIARPVELLLAGRLVRTSGARATVNAACDGRACPDRGAVQRLLLTPEPGARDIALEVAPLDLAPLSGGADAAYRHLRVEGGVLAWRALPGAVPAHRPGAVPVRLSDRDGAVLWSDGRPSPQAVAAGLAPLLGIHREQAGGVAGMLSRLGGTGHEARLSIDPVIQPLAAQLLDCIGLRQGSWDGRACSGGIAPPAQRRAGLVVLDTRNGDILAAASAGAGPADPARWTELRDFDRAEPARSPLRIAAFQHDGGAHNAPGSTFKVVSALGLEQAARDDARLDALLAGAPLARLDALAAGSGYGFRSGAATYPDNARAHITNFREQTTAVRATSGRFGLDTALTYSVNTWFAWMAELSDASLLGQPEGGVPGVRALEPGALDALRPVAGMARKLGFGQPLRLDAALLPPDYRWMDWDVLQPTPAALDPVLSRHELRQMAIGLRMQATPLQMALVAAAVAEGRTVQPRLLLELDGRAGSALRGEALGVRLDRIRAGMKGVIDRGTAASAFAGVKTGLFGKTGTAPTGPDGLATVWFMGWLEPGSLPGQTRRLAFAAYVSHSEATGGGHAAPVVAALLRSLRVQSPEKKEK